MKKEDPFLDAYIACALWAETDADGEPLDLKCSPKSLHVDTRRRMREDCVKFQQDHADLLKGLDLAQCGHDFWLTRNCHGAGFWDRGLGEVGEKLTEAAAAFRECTLYVGDDGEIYC